MKRHTTVGTIGLSLAMAAGLGLTGCSSKSSSKGFSGATAAATTSGTASSGGTTGGGTPPPPGRGGAAVGAWYKGDLHSHSAPYSQDAQRQGGDSPGMAFFLADQAGLDFLALTDHRTMDQINDPTYSSSAVTILSGEEWGGTVHIGMAGLSQQVPELDMSRGASSLNAQVQAAYDDAHRQGGVVTANHPCLPGKEHTWLSHSFDAVEVWNIYWAFPYTFDANDQGVSDKVQGLGLTAIGEDANPEIRAAVANRGGGSNHQALKFYDENLNRGRHLAAVGGGDRHSITFPGLPTTYVWAEDSSHDKIIAGIKAARTWVGSSEGPIVEFRADGDGDGVFESMIGDSVSLGRPITYQVRVQNALDGRVDVIKNGQTVSQFAVLSNDETFTWTDTSSSRSWMRLNVLEKVDFRVPRGGGFQLLALGSLGFGSGSSGLSALTTLATPFGFQVSVGTRYPTIRLPHDLDKILNMDKINWGYSMGAITSPIWAE